MKVITFTAPHDRRLGLLRYSNQNKPVPEDTYFFFPWVGNDPFVTMNGMKEPLRLVFLTRQLEVTDVIYAEPDQDYLIPPRSAHMVEMSVNTQFPEHWMFLRHHV